MLGIILFRKVEDYCHYIILTTNKSEADIKDTFLLNHFGKSLNESKVDCGNFKFDEIKNEKAHMLDFYLFPKLQMPFLTNFPRISSLLINSIGEDYEVHFSGTRSDKKLFVDAMEDYLCEKS